MPVAVAGLVLAAAGGVASAFGAGAAQRRQNRQAAQAWTQESIEKGIFNAREMFLAGYNIERQRKVNENIFQAALKYDMENSEYLRKKESNIQRQIANKYITDTGTIQLALASNGVSVSSGTANALSFSTLMAAIKDVSTAETNAKIERQNLETQKNNMLNQRTYDIFIPNLSTTSEAPRFGSPGAAVAGGLASTAMTIGIGLTGFKKE